MKQGMALSTFKTASGQFLGLLFGAAAMKILAVLAGPAGVGLYSVLRQLQQILSSVASLGGQNAIVQGLSTLSGLDRERFFVSTLYMFLMTSLLVGGLVMIFSEVIAGWVLAGEHVAAIRWLVVPIVLGALLFFFRGVLTSDMQYGAVAFINMLTGLGAAVVAVPSGFAFVYGYPEFLVFMLGGTVIPPLMFAFFYVRRLGYLRNLSSFAPSVVSRYSISKFLEVALPLLLSLVLTLGCVLVVRAKAVHLYGLEGAGLFDAAWSVSAMYLALFLASLQSYLLPELSKTEKGPALQSALSRAFHFALILSLPLIVGLVVLKPLVMSLLFSEAFSPALDVLRWVLLGDFVRVLGWVISTTLIARADMKGFALAEALWSMIFVSLAWVLLPLGIEWIGVAYLVGYVAYLGLLSHRLWQLHGVRLEARRVGQWLAGLSIVIVTSWLCWDGQAVMSWTIILIFPAFFFSFYIMQSDERQFALHLVSRSFGLLKRYFGQR
ncbi:oligosaccharide flippase family protein [Ectopseudomonas khazarica]|uniref:oligosaccharide flippase family protein n=1 Tax=Ectopseudomonas khazarica TaxID=2502979 RepID=UPI003B94DBFA